LLVKTSNIRKTIYWRSNEKHFELSPSGVKLSEVAFELYDLCARYVTTDGRKL